MKCPHCRVEFHSKPSTIVIGQDAEGAWQLRWENCPACRKMSLKLQRGGVAYTQPHNTLVVTDPKVEFLVHPRGSLRPACPAEVPTDLSNDYKEACVVLPDSAKASAALSRRCLQHLLREVVKVKPGNLADEIQQVIDSGKLPSYLAESIDGVRNIGNFAAHTIKSQSSGEVLPVEIGEADWNLDTLEALFDFYFVQPEIIRKKREALNQKLKDSGKPPMK